MTRCDCLSTEASVSSRLNAAHERTDHVPKVEMSFTDPDAVRIDTPSGVWFLLGARNIEQSSIDSLTTTGEAEDFCRRNRGALVVFVETHGSNAVMLCMWRGLFSTYELFFSQRPSGDVIVSDHFRNVLAALPVADRLPSEHGLVAHYLTRKPYGTTTYSASVTRLPQAESVRIDLTTGSTDLSMFDEITADADKRPSEEYVKAIDGALGESFANIPQEGGTAMMFSGGVDSTLLMTYAPKTTVAITFVPDTPEFQAETAYARSAISLLGGELHEVPTPEARFVEMLEAVTDALGTPCFDDSNPYFAELVLNQPYDNYVFGQGADSAFGMSLKLSRFSSWFRFPGVRHAVSGAAPYVPGHLGYRLGQVAPKAEGFSKDLLDPEGYAGNSRSFGNTTLFQKTVDPSSVARVKAEQLEFVTKRVNPAANPDSAFLSHIELSHWMVVLGNSMMLQRLVAQSVGRRVLGPYMDADVLSELAMIPVEERYIQGLRAKWVLKDLIDQRVPGYPSNQRKKATALPYQRFYTDGPLTTIWDRYDVPDIFEGELRDELVSSPSTSTWNAITYAVWEQRVAKNPDLEPHDAHLAASFTIETG